MAEDFQPPLDRQGVVLRYVFAGVPLLLYAVVITMLADLGVRGGHVAMLMMADPAFGVLGLVLMWWRRRRPLPVALVCVLLAAVSFTAFGPACVAYVSLCTHRRWRLLVPVAVVFWVSLAVAFQWQGNPTGTLVYAALSAVVVGALTVFGLYVRGRRDLAATQRRAVLEAQAQRVEQAKLAERLTIAQEMHDVLAHRISLLSMLAGGLAYRTDLSPEETREAALAIQENAHQSLNELRGVLGGLRGGGPPERPQPGLGQLGDLFDEVRGAGQEVEVADTIDGRDLLPAQTARHAYRIVQEALTNARKHAPGSRVAAQLGGRPGDGLRIRVSNAAPYGTPAGPGAKLGLVGLAERTRMAGGTLRHAVQDGYFVLEARLPWEAAQRDSTGDRG